MNAIGGNRQRPVTVVAVGDLMLGDSPLAAGYGWHSTHPGEHAKLALEGLRSALSGADIAFGNLEVQLTKHGVGRTRMERDMMRGDPEYAAILRDLGFNVLAVANNHAMQHGVRAFDETVATLRHAGIDVAGLRGTDGWNAEPVRRTTPCGATVGILAYSLRPRQYGTGDPSYADGPEFAILEDATRLSTEVDYLIVSLHWGEEFAAQPSIDEVAFARRLSDAGVDLIVGHHPHVARPVVSHGSTCIAYSLGNAVSDMIWQPQFTQGIALRCELGEESHRIGLLKLFTDRSYAVRSDGKWDYGALPADLDGLSKESYQAAVDASMGSYRRAGLRHMVLNAWRSPLDVTVEFTIVKARNLLARVLGSAEN